MKMKLFLFLSLIVGSISLSVFFSNTTFAAGENYKWINETTIEGSGGSYDNKVFTSQKDGPYTNKDVAIKTVRFIRAGTTSEFKVQTPTGGIFTMTNGPGGTSSSKCGLQLMVTINTKDIAAGTLRINDPDKTICPGTGLATSFGIGETANGPAAGSVTPPGAGPDDPTPSMCGVDGIGWFICPIANSIADGISGVFDIVKEFLVFKSYSTDTKNGIYPAWSVMRNFANVAFVVAFMIIIYSQLTSLGISNYGIKKMLPRLIVAAILVNSSYWICGIAVDVSNILGASLNSLFNGFIPAVKGDGIDVKWQDATLTILSGTAVGGISAAMLAATTASIGALLWMLVPILLSAVFAVLVALVVLAGRQVILIILIVISPLAFVAYLLPNTSKWYSKWQSAFFTLLLMYPMIAVIFGGSQLASAIILSADNLSMVMVLLALAVQVIPLAITPIVMKLSTGVLGRFAGIVNNPKSGPIDALKNRAKENQELATKRGLDPNNRGFMNRMGQRRDTKRRTRELRGKSYEAGADASWQERVAQDESLSGINNNLTAQNSRGSEAQRMQKKNYMGALNTDASLLETAAGIGGDDASNRIKAAVDQEARSEINKAIEDIKSKTEGTVAPGSAGIVEIGAKFDIAVKEGNTIEARAMQDLLLTKGQAGINEWRKRAKALEGVAAMDTDTGTMKASTDTATFTELRRDLLSKHAALKASAIDVNTLGVKGGNLSDVQTDPGTYQMSDEELIHQKPSTIRLALDNNAITPEQAKRIMDNPDIAKHLDNSIQSATGTTQRQDIQALADQVVPHNPQPAQQQPPAGPTPPSNP